MSRSLSSLPSSDSLSSPLPVVINTRPIERAAPLTCHLQAAGFTVVDIPMLALQPRPVTDADMALMRQWLAGEYQALVIVSPTAAASGLAVWQTLAHENKNDDVNNQSLASLPKPPSHLIAVGEATAAVLNNVALPSFSYQVLQPTIANNEGMLVMPEIEGLQAGDKLLVWRGLGGRRLLVDTLQARGVHIDSIAWYERTMPATASAQYQHWQQQFNVSHNTLIQRPKPVVIISSGTAFEHWLSVVEQAQSIDSDSNINLNTNTNLNQVTALKLSDFSYVVLGARLADMLAERSLSYWRVEDLAPQTILAALQS
ncbi:uroporphyrinogen-III synthase [Psychrobacter urativorans]|uniref:Uroporphyrinogen-III synthase n=1 Tax=Psychrobacter urativorans TaxID=45610 RepID=A0A0M4SXT9_9GAMM|nr:uroporphyrinogen-III synthase [Psychrobacter urativorans]ALF59798.1 uroporphyrinogen III synthase [Psychrobacter urativorans]